MSEVSTLHDPFARWLREKSVPFIRARSDRESTIAIGWPDFSLVKASRVLLIEFKTKEGKLSPEQVARIATIEAAGTKVHVLRDLATAIELTTHWLSTLDDIPIIAPKRERPKQLIRHALAWYEETPTGLQKVRNLTAQEIADNAR